MLDSRVILVFISAIATGCSLPYKPETLQEPNGMRDGPGLFSGPEGNFTLYASDVNVDETKSTDHILPEPLS